MNINNQKTITIGRSPKNDCIFENQSVSSNHAILYLLEDGNGAVIKDLNSTNGTYINQGPKILSSVKITFDDTINFGSEQTSLSDIIARAKKTKVQERNLDFSGLLHKTIGKSKDNDIVMNYNDVSRKHAVIYKDLKGNIIIEDLGSTNGTYVNGLKITSCTLNDGDTVTITRNYPLVWKNLFSLDKPIKKTALLTIAGLISIFLILFAGNKLISGLTWDKEKIYKEYSQSVCMVYNSYGYKIFIDGQDMTQGICQFLQIPVAEYIHMENDKISSGTTIVTGTAFFISEDGKLATNLHVAHPWAYSNEKKIFENITNKILTLLSTRNPMLLRSKLEVKGIVTNLAILPNGLPLTSGNLIECIEYKAYDDGSEKDVAIIQTSSHELPSKTLRIFDLNEINVHDDGISEGKTIYTIGYPYGTSVALNSRNEIVNQIHQGQITQNRGEFEFGHDAETAGGASGSPIIDEKGKLIGIHHAGLTGLTGAQGFNRAIKAKFLLDLLN